MAVHVRALLAVREDAASVETDLTDPAAALAPPDVSAVIDAAEPVCIVFGLVLSLAPARQAREVVAGYADVVAPGSCVAVSCGRCDDEALWVKLRKANTAADLYNHTLDEVAGCLADLELVPPVSVQLCHAVVTDSRQIHTLVHRRPVFRVF